MLKMLMLLMMIVVNQYSLISPLWVMLIVPSSMAGHIRQSNGERGQGMSELDDSYYDGHREYQVA